MGGKGAAEGGCGGGGGACPLPFGGIDGKEDEDDEAGELVDGTMLLMGGSGTRGG